jgi:hypothetical protein
MKKIKFFLFIVLATAWLWIKPIHLYSHHVESPSESCMVCLVVDHQQMELPSIEFLKFFLLEIKTQYNFFETTKRNIENNYFARGPPVGRTLG